MAWTTRLLRGQLPVKPDRNGAKFITTHVKSGCLTSSIHFPWCSFRHLSLRLFSPFIETFIQWVSRVTSLIVWWSNRRHYNTIFLIVMTAKLIAENVAQLSLIISTQCRTNYTKVAHPAGWIQNNLYFCECKMIYFSLLHEVFQDA
jgi:hypothetical protein